MNLLTIKPAVIKTCVFVQVTKQDCRYLVVERNAPEPRIMGCGFFELQESGLATQLRAQLVEQKIKVKHAVLLLPRSELEVFSLNLPPASPDELPELVQAALLQEQDDPGNKRVHDFVITHQDAQSIEVTAFSKEAQVLSRWTQEFKAAGMTLTGITFSGIGASELLPTVAKESDHTNLVLTLSDQDLDLVVCDGANPILFRTLPWSAEDEHQFADRLGEEIPRTNSLAHRLGEDVSSQVFLVGEQGEFETNVRALTELIADPITIIDPTSLVQCRVSVPQASRFGNLVGVALAWNRGPVALNLLAPRKALRPAGPAQKYALLGIAVGLIVVIFGYQIWQASAQQLAEVQKLQTKLKGITKRSSKSRELQTLVNTVADWRQDEINWLEELRLLAERLPPSDQALIRKMNLAVDPMHQAVIDLTVQVSKPEVVTLLEDALRVGDRSVTSNRVSELDIKSKLPWGFDTRVLFQPEQHRELPVPEQTADSVQPQNKAAERSSGKSTPAKPADTPAREATSVEATPGETTSDQTEPEAAESSELEQSEGLTP